MQTNKSFHIEFIFKDFKTRPKVFELGKISFVEFCEKEFGLALTDPSFSYILLYQDLGNAGRLKQIKHFSLFFRENWEIRLQ